jgi:hypothetical protein
MYYLRYICLFAHSGVLFFVLYAPCCQFIWIVHFECPLGILERLLKQIVSRSDKKRPG